MNDCEKREAEGIVYTDEYQLTMAQLYFRMGMHEKMAQFDHFFRDYPDYGDHRAGYCINAGLEWLLDWMKEARFREVDIEKIRERRGATGHRIFHDDFLSWLREHGNFDGISMRAVPEGRVVHANVPMTVVSGPLAMAQILETPLLNLLNYQTLIATRASRISSAARGNLVLEFGLRRAQERGAHAGTRGALIGGADFSSNVGGSHVMGLPPKGTHAHSMVQAFIALGHSELEAFRAYADVYPDDCLLLVDTIDTLGSGVPNAIKVFEELRSKGHDPVGIRLDSGDLAYLAIESAKMLNAAGFPDVKIVLSNKLDEIVIWQILTQIEDEACKNGVDPDQLIGRLVYGVGTNLITSEGHAALDGVYKLTALRNDGEWKAAMKISETPAKTLNPGAKEVWRLYDEREKATADLLAFADEKPSEKEHIVLRHPVDPAKKRSLAKKNISEIEALLEHVLKEGKLVCELPSLDEIRRRRDRDLSRTDSGVKRLVNPHIYHVSLSEALWKAKKTMLDNLKGGGLK